MQVCIQEAFAMSTLRSRDCLRIPIMPRKYLSKEMPFDLDNRSKFHFYNDANRPAFPLCLVDE